MDRIWKKNILLTGAPGTGKTTLFKKIASNCAIFRPVGFYTGEIREQGARVGFSLVNLSGGERILSHVLFRGQHRVGRYTVDIGGFESFIKDALTISPETRLVMIDEIGKMECLSALFRSRVRAVLDAEILLVATIALHGSPAIESIKTRDDVAIYHVTRENRETLAEEIARVVTELVN